MPRPAILEAFEVINGGVGNQPSADWLDGHNAGYSEGLAASEAEQEALSAALVQTFADMRFGYQEARNHMATSLRPLFESLITAFAPAFAKEMLAPHIAEQLASIAVASIDSPVTISVAPSQHDELLKSLALLTDLPFTLHGDPALRPNQAILNSTQGEIAVDLDSIIAQTQDILTALLDQTEREADHG